MQRSVNSFTVDCRHSDCPRNDVLLHYFNLSPKGQEVSGYIDLAHRMRTEDFTSIFECRKRLLPKPSDLSYFNWDTNLSTSNSTPHYQVIADSAQGLLFKNKRDRKIVNVNPESLPGDNTTRIEVDTTEYVQVVFYDHSTRRRL